MLYHSLSDLSESYKRRLLRIVLADLYESVFSFHNFKPSEQSSYCVSELIFCQHIRQIIFMLIDVT